MIEAEFDEKIPRRTAIVVKQDDWGLPFAYPADWGKIGYLLDSRNTSGYNEVPVLSTSFAEYAYSERWYGLEKTPFYFGKMTYKPSMVTREVNFSNMGLLVDETFCQGSGGGFIWDLDCESINHPNTPLQRKLFTVFTMADRQSKLSFTENHAVIEYASDKAEGAREILHVVSDFDKVAIYDSIDDFKDDAKKGEMSKGAGEGRYIVFQHDILLPRGERKSVRFSMDFGNAEKALMASREDLPASAISDKWNSWFETLPKPACEDESLLRAYYKCWFVTRLNYYDNPRFGRTMIEALPVYRGYWQWALTGHEIAGDNNPELGSDFVRTVIDLFLKYQREDGYVTHAIYLSEEIPGSGWAEESVVQTPHIPWVAMRYFNKTQDVDALRRWYPALKKYHQYLCESRDVQFKNIHLWGITTSYDTGLDTTSVFERVTYGENGIKENFCYPAIFAAERARFEQALCKMADVLDNGDAQYWAEESHATILAMEEYLWDDHKKWFGVIHEDGTLDTRVGVDGLFPFAYQLVDRKRADEARENFEKLIGKYGVHTVAPDEDGFYGRIYWRGSSWPKSISMAAGTAMNYFPDLAEKLRGAAVNFALKYPNIWECMDPRDGMISRGDSGVIATPNIATNVGAAELLGAFLQLEGVRMLDF